MKGKGQTEPPLVQDCLLLLCILPFLYLNPNFMSGPQRWTLGGEMPLDHSVPLPNMVFSAGHHFISTGTIQDGWPNLACQATGRTWALTNNCSHVIPEVLLSG